MTDRYAPSECNGRYASLSVRPAVRDTKTGEHARFITTQAAAATAVDLNGGEMHRSMLLWHDANDDLPAEVSK